MAVQIRVYEDIRIRANTPSASVEVVVPQGNWRVVSLVALATVAGNVGNMVANVVTTDVETVIALNQVERLRATTESGAVQPFIFGGPVRTTATKKIALADVFRASDRHAGAELTHHVAATVETV